MPEGFKGFGSSKKVEKPKIFDLEKIGDDQESISIAPESETIPETLPQTHSPIEIISESYSARPKEKKDPHAEELNEEIDFKETEQEIVRKEIAALEEERRSKKFTGKDYETEILKKEERLKSLETVTPGASETRKELRADLTKKVQALDAFARERFTKHKEKAVAYDSLAEDKTLVIEKKEVHPGKDKTENKIELSPGLVIERREKWANELAEKHGITAEREALMAAEAKYKSAHTAHHGKLVNAFQKIDANTQKEYNDARFAWTKAINDKIGNLSSNATQEEKREYVKAKVVLHHDTILRSAEARNNAREAALSEKSKSTVRKALNWSVNRVGLAAKWYAEQLEVVGKGIGSVHHAGHKLLNKGKEMSPSELKEWEARYARVTGVVAGAAVGSLITALTGGSSALAATTYWGILGARLGAAGIGTMVGSATGAMAEKVVRGNSKKDISALKKIKGNEAFSSAGFAGRDEIYDKGNRRAVEERVIQAKIAGTVVGGIAGGMGTNVSLHSVFNTHAVHNAVNQAASMRGVHHLPGISLEPHTASTSVHHVPTHSSEFVSAKHGEGAYKLFNDLQEKLGHDHDNSELGKLLQDHTQAQKLLEGLHLVHHGQSIVIPEGSTLSVQNDHLILSHNGHDTVLIEKDSHGNFNSHKLDAHDFAKKSGLQYDHHSAAPAHHSTDEASTQTHSNAVSEADTTSEQKAVYAYEKSHGTLPKGGSSDPTIHKIIDGTYQDTPAHVASAERAPAPDVHHDAPSTPATEVVTEHMNAHNVPIDAKTAHLYAASAGPGKPEQLIAFGSNDSIISKAQEYARANPGKTVYFNSPEKVYADGKMVPWVSQVTYTANGGYDMVLPTESEYVGAALNPDTFIKRIS
jgi:hypothetical protein